MPTHSISYHTREKVDYGVTAGGTTINRSYRTLTRRLINELRSSIAGAGSDGTFTFQYDAADIAYANSGLAVSSGSGTVGATLNGVATTATWATSDTVAAALIANAINTSSTAKVKGMFFANNLSMTITLASVTAGQYVDICGTRFTATNGVPPTIYSGQLQNTFDISGADAADATALAAAINASPDMTQWVFAIPVSNAVRLFPRKTTYTAASTSFAMPTGSRYPVNIVTASAATFTLSGSQMVASAFVGIQAQAPGVIGNCFTIAASGTGITVLNSETYLMRGVALDGGFIIGET